MLRLKDGFILELIKATNEKTIHWEVVDGNTYNTQSEDMTVVFNKDYDPEFGVDTLSACVVYKSGEMDIINTTRQSPNWDDMGKLYDEISKQHLKIAA